MFVLKNKFDEVLAKIDVWQRIAGEAEREKAYSQAYTDSQKVIIEKLEKQIEQLIDEKKQLMEDLLIASGVKRSKFDEAILQRQLNEQPEATQYNQSRQWASHMEQANMTVSEQEKQERARQLMKQLEEEFEASK